MNSTFIFIIDELDGYIVFLFRLFFVMKWKSVAMMMQQRDLVSD